MPRALGKRFTPLPSSDSPQFFILKTLGTAPLIGGRKICGRKFFTLSTLLKDAVGAWPTAARCSLSPALAAPNAADARVWRTSPAALLVVN
jgi:hypothetical protein